MKPVHAFDSAMMKSNAPSLLAAAMASLCALLMSLSLSVRASEAADDGALESDAERQAQIAENADDSLAILSADHNHHWFTVAPDPRLCPSPLCGGYLVTRVNRPFTVCANGTRAATCYVADLDLSLAGLSPEQETTVRRAAGHLLIRGTIRQNDVPPFGNLGVLRGQEAWIGHARIRPSGTFYRAHGTSIVCFAFPCPTVRIAPLNQPRSSRTIADIYLGAVTADPRDGYAQLNEPQGLLTAGTLAPVSGPAGTSVKLDSTEYYLPVTPEVGLCSSSDLSACTKDEFCDFPEKADCGRADQPGVCEPRPQACITLYDPVCGCDGITYSNSCVAHAAGVSVDYSGPCGGKP
jgi:hypothetical protein